MINPFRRLAKKWFGVAHAGTRHNALEGRRPSFRPMLERLEDRTLLSGTPGALDSFLLTPVPETARIAVHIHPHLTILVNGQDQVIPANIGVKASGDLPMHTHDTSGTIHIESPVAQDFTLQNFFTVWGQSFSSQNILGHQVDAADPLTVTVNGRVSSAFGSLVLHDQDNIVIQYGSTPKAKLSTDRLDYAPGTTAVFSGSGFAAGETVTLQVVHTDGLPNTDASHTPWTVVADAAGAIRTTWVVDTVDGAHSTLDVLAVGATSRSAADAAFTDSTTPRPFWIFAHNPNTIEVAKTYINLGVNALEPDVEFFAGKSTDPVTKGFYIAHQLDTSGIAPYSNYSQPTLSVHDYLDQLSLFLSTRTDKDGNLIPNTQLSLIELDVKTEATQAAGALAYLVNTINTEILPQHPELYFLLNAGTVADATSLFTSTAETALKDVPLASRSHFAFSIDGENDASSVKQTLRTLLGADALIAYGDGTSGCCGVYGDTAVVEGFLTTAGVAAALEAIPELAFLDIAALIAGQFIYAGPNTPGSLQSAVYDRTAAGDFNMIAYGFSITGLDSMKMLIDSGVDGLIPADSLDITSPFSIHGFSAVIGGKTIGNVSYGDTADALNLVRGGYGGTFLATTADDPFSIPGAKTHGSGGTATATVDTANDATKGQVTGVTITNGGTYTSAPTVTFSGGGGGGAAGTAAIDAAGHVTAVTLTNHGSGYTSAPVVTLNSVVTVTGSRQGYALEVYTSDILGAGTDSLLTFTLIGEKGSASATVDTNFPKEMEQGYTNHVFIPSADLGKLKSITVFNHNGAFLSTSEWNVDTIKVRSLAYIGPNATDFYEADYGGQDIGNAGCVSFGLLGDVCIDTGDQNPSSRPLVMSNYLTGTARASATGGVEGATAAALSGATFHDRNLTNTIFSVTAVTWGDGSTDATGLTISGSNGDYTVNGSHLYSEEGNYAFSITVKAGGTGPDANQTATIYGEVDVSDPAVALTPATFRATEGILSAVQTLATFTDPGGAEAPADYSVDVDWGNGTFVSGDANVSISAPLAGVFTVTGKHLYADEDGFTGPVRVRISHEASTGSPVVSDVSVPLTLIDPPVSATGATAPFRATEGAMSAVQTLATFTDPGGAEALADYTVDVDWGNGTFVSGDANVGTSVSVVGLFTITGRHLYTDEDGFTGPVRVRINHEGSTPSTVVSVPLTLTDPPVIATGATAPFRATEGAMSAVQTLATFTDPGGPETPADYAVDVDWGNGTFVPGDANVSISAPVFGVFTVRASHLYREEDGFPGPVRVRINHEGSTPSPVVSVPLILTDPPLIAAGTILTVVRGSCPTQTVATFTDPGGAEPNLFDAGPLGNHYAATIHWGDGTPDDMGAITYNGIPLDDSPTNPFTVSAHHVYTTNGTYTITVTLHHEGAVPDAVVTDKVTVVSLLNHSQGYGDPNSLVIGAALSGSSILVVPVGKQTGALTDSVQVLIDGVAQINTATGGTTFTGFNTLTIFGQAGNDNLEVAGGVKKNASIFAGDGNDRIKGGAGNNILMGGLGDDLIIGGSGQDIMIGGGGNDRLVGGPGGDIMIAGYTDFDDPCTPASVATLNAIRAVWTNSAAGYNSRAAAVLALFSTAGTNAGHIHHDISGVAQLTGSSGQDLFFVGLFDKVTGKPLNKK